MHKHLNYKAQCIPSWFLCLFSPIQLIANDQKSRNNVMDCSLQTQLPHMGASRTGQFEPAKTAWSAVMHLISFMQSL